MKELSEEKAKAYDESLEKAKQVYNDCICCRKCLNELFPILTESKDEKIRKEIISAIKEDWPEHTDWIAWLEKQGEQKPAGKVEPKFHEGEWVVNNTTLNSCHIVKVEHGQYICDDCSFPITKENEYHLWTIQDAKDGDVVVDKSDGAIGIFQSIGHHPDGGSCNDPSYCILHCHYDDGFFWAYFEHGNTIDSDDLIPATKEQREQLEKAMADAGYTFDFEKKELKKIEQKPAWSEEDESKLKSILFHIEDVENKDVINWLKSLKERYTWKPSDQDVPDGELTEFEKDIRDIITAELCNNFGDVSFGISISEDEAKLIAHKLLPVARRQIASEIDINEMCRRVKFDRVLYNAIDMSMVYRHGIENAIRAIQKVE